MALFSAIMMNSLWLLYFSQQSVRSASLPLKITHVLNAIDPTIKPCDDFYEFSCGAFRSKYANKLTDVQPVIDIGYNLYIKNVEQINKTLANQTRDNLEYNFEKAALDLYSSCMHRHPNNSLGVNDSLYLPVIERIFKPSLWEPFISYFVKGENQTLRNKLIDQLNSSSLVGSKTVLENLLTDIAINEPFLDIFWTMSIIINYKSTNQSEIFIGQNKKLYYGEAILPNFTNYVYHIMKPFGLSIQDVKNLIKLEKRLHKYNDDSTNQFTLGEMNKKFNMNWTNYMSQIYKAHNLSFPLDTLFEVEYEYMNHVNKTLQEYLKDQDKIVVVNDYVMFLVVHHFLPHLPSSFKAERHSVELYMNKKLDEPSFAYCVNKVNDLLPGSLEYQFLKNITKRVDIDMVRSVVNNLTKMAIKELNKIHWIGNESKRLIAEKLLGIKWVLGAPSHLFDPEYLEDLHRGVLIHPHEFHRNAMELSKNENKYKLVKLLILPREYKENPNAIYKALCWNYRYINTIYIPYGNLVEPFFHHTYPMAIIYGRLGYILAHEMFHSLDPQGIWFDLYGVNRKLINQSHVKEHEDRLQCFKNQYSNYFWDDYNRIDGTRSLNENLVDNDGLKLAYKTYKSLNVSTGTEYFITENTTINDDQLFFVGFSQTWCEIGRKEFNLNEVKSGVYAPARMRIMAAVRNFKSFDEAFDCPTECADKYLYKRCSMWL